MAKFLAQALRPFLLRRTKEAVAAELPPKTEILCEVPLAGDQRDLYETLRLALHERVRREVENKGLVRSSIVILDSLLKQDVIITGNLNYLFKFAYMAKHLQRMFTIE